MTEDTVTNAEQKDYIHTFTSYSRTGCKFAGRKSENVLETIGVKEQKGGGGSKVVQKVPSAGALSWDWTIRK